MIDGKSLAECAAASIAPASSAASISLVNRPLPPASASGRAWVASPVVRMTLSAIRSISQPCASARRSRVSFACMSASGEPRAPSVNKGGEVIGSGLSFEKDPVKLGYFEDQPCEKSVAAIGGFSPWNGRKRRSLSSFPVAVRATRCHLSAAMKTLLLAFVVTLAASPVLAADDGYPPGLFEHSPVQPGPNDPPDSQG